MQYLTLQASSFEVQYIYYKSYPRMPRMEITIMCRTKRTLLAMTIALVFASAAFAVVETFDATVSAEVRESLGPDVVNSDSAFEQLGETTGNLPLIVEALLTQAETEDAGAGVKTTFSDPRATETPDPNEFGLAVVGFSREGDAAYAAVGGASETRSVTFTASEIGASEGTGLTAQSYFFLDGLLVIWGESGNTDLTGTSASMTLRIEQWRSSDDQGTTVLEAALMLAGPPSDSPPESSGVPLGGDVLCTANGALTVDNVIQMDISDLVPELGTIQLVIIPGLSIPYTYMASVEEPFTLHARVEGETHNRPGTGAAVMLGVPLSQLTGLIDEVSAEGVSEDFEEVLQTLLSAGLIAAKPLPESDGTTKITVNPSARLFAFAEGPLCGILGAESAVLSIVFAVLAMLTWRSKS